MAQDIVEYSEQQRVDLPDFDFLIKSSEIELKRTLNNLFIKSGVIVKGFSLANGTGLTCALDKSSERVSIDKNGLLLIDSEVGANLVLDLVASSTNYIEMDFAHVQVEKALRPFFDIDAGEEFHKEVFTRTKLTPTFYVNQSGFSTDRISLGTFTTDATDITASTDERKFIYSDNGYTWAATRTDKDIETIDDQSNANYSILKELKGTPEWFDAPATTLQRIFDLSVAVILGDDSAALDLGTDTLTSPAFNLLMTNKSFNYVVDAINEVILDKESLYVVLPINADGNFIASGGNLAIVKSDSVSFPNDSKNFLICTRIGNSVLFNKGGLKLPDYGSDINITDGASIVSAISSLDFKIATAINNATKDLDSPLALKQTTIADSLLNLSIAPTVLSDGSNRSLPPLSSQVFELPVSTIDFQTQVTTGATFEVSWPASGVVDEYIRAGFSLLPSGTIKVLFSPEAADIPSLANAGTLLISSGIPIGYINLRTTDVLGKWKTASSSTSIIENADIFRFGSGGSGGSGSGDASLALTRLEDVLDSSFYQYLEPNIISSDEDTKVDTTNAVFDFVSRTYGFTTAQALTSYPLLDDDFLLDLNDVLKAQVAIIFDKSQIDTAPIVHLTNNGVDYQAVTTERVSPSSNTFIGEIEFDLSTLVKQNLFEYPSSNIDADIILNITNNIEVAQEFTTGADTTVHEFITAYLIKTGTPTGFIEFKLYEGGANPSTIKALGRIDIADIVNGANISNIGRQVLKKNTQYFISISTDSEYKSTYSAGVDEIKISSDASTPTISDVRVYDGTAWSASAGVAIPYLLEGRKLDLRLRYTASEDSSLVGYGVFYGHTSQAAGRTFKRNAFIFDGTNDNLNEFQLTFSADADLLEIQDGGQRWAVPHFELSSSNKIIFPVGFFDGRDLVHLIAIQKDGSQTDNSDANRRYIAQNFLGGDVGLDYSVAGRGFKLRDELDGKQYEAYLSGGQLKFRYVRD